MGKGAYGIPIWSMKLCRDLNYIHSSIYILSSYTSSTHLLANYHSKDKLAQVSDSALSQLGLDECPLQEGTAGPYGVSKKPLVLAVLSGATASSTTSSGTVSPPGCSCSFPLPVPPQSSWLALHPSQTAPSHFSQACLPVLLTVCHSPALLAVPPGDLPRSVLPLSSPCSCASWLENLLVS